MSGGVLTIPSHMVWTETSRGCNIGDHDEYCLTDRWTDIWYCGNRVSSCSITYVVQQDTQLLLWLNIYSQYIWRLDVFRTYRSIPRSIYKLCAAGLVCEDCVLLGSFHNLLTYGRTEQHTIFTYQTSSIQFIDAPEDGPVGPKHVELSNILRINIQP